MNDVLSPGRRQLLLLLGLTAIFVAYFLVWLPGPGAGLSLIGLELGEWIKFLGVGRLRDLFYLPPIVLGLLLALWTATWQAGRGRPWAVRLLAVGVALLAFPAVAAITGELPSEWMVRLILIAFVAVVAGGSAWLGRRLPAASVWLLMLVVALLGAALPLGQYVAVRPVVADLLRRPVGLGSGVWVYLIGCGLVALVAALEAAAHRTTKESHLFGGSPGKTS